MERSVRSLLLIPDNSIACITDARERHVNNVGVTDAAQRTVGQLEDAVVGKKKTTMAAMFAAASDCSNTS